MLGRVADEGEIGGLLRCRFRDDVFTGPHMLFISLLSGALATMSGSVSP